MICQECGVEFATTKIDAVVVSEQDVYCSEFCCVSEGWFTDRHLSQRTAALLQKLENTIERVPQHRVFTALEQPLLEDTLAILRSESGAQRAAGPPATLPLILAALRQLRADGWYGPGVSQGKEPAFWEETLVQLEATLIVLQQAVD